MAEPNEKMTVIAVDTQIIGEMKFEQTARILGKFEGKINAKGELQVAQGALCKAEVKAANVTIDGTVEGNINASKQVKLNANATMTGNVTAEKLVMSDGASLFGQVAVGTNAAKPAAPGAKAEQAPPASQHEPSKKQPVSVG